MEQKKQAASRHVRIVGDRASSAQPERRVSDPAAGDSAARHEEPVDSGLAMGMEGRCGCNTCS